MPKPMLEYIVGTVRRSASGLEIKGPHCKARLISHRAKLPRIEFRLRDLFVPVPGLWSSSPWHHRPFRRPAFDRSYVAQCRAIDSAPHHAGRRHRCVDLALQCLDRRQQMSTILPGDSGLKDLAVRARCLGEWQFLANDGA